MPLHAKFYWKRWRIVLTVVLIFCSSFLLACYNFVWMSPVSVSYCNNTVFNYGLRPVNETVSPKIHKYVQISLLISPFFIVCLPMILLIVLNSNLLYYLHRNRKNMLNASNAPQMKVNEHKVAFMVAVIILSFIILSTPSAILYLYDWFTTYVTKSRRSATYIKAATVANLLVVVNKASNFVLYCSASSHFRRRLMGLICRQSVAGRCGSFSSRISSQRRSTVTSLLGTNDGSNWIVQQLQKMSLAKTNVSSSTSGSKDDLLEMSNLLRKRSRSLLKERRFSHPSQVIIMPAHHNHRRAPTQRRLSQPAVTKRDSRNSLWWNNFHAPVERSRLSAAAHRRICGKLQFSSFGAIKTEFHNAHWLVKRKLFLLKQTEFWFWFCCSRKNLCNQYICLKHFLLNYIRKLYSKLKTFCINKV